MAKRTLTPEQIEVNDLKKIYYKELHAAQARYRYYAKRPGHAKYSLAFAEAERGGQFSFAGAQEIGDIYAEVARMRQFVSLDRNAANMSRIRIEAQAKRAEKYLDLFEPDVSMSERVARGLNQNIDETLYRIYRRLEEEAPGLINYGGLMSSEQFIAMLYNELVEGESEANVQLHGHQVLESMKEENPYFIKDIPINSFLTHKDYAKYREQMTDEELQLFMRFKQLDPETIEKLLGGKYGL